MPKRLKAAIGKQSAASSISGRVDEGQHDIGRFRTRGLGASGKKTVGMVEFPRGFWFLDQAEKSTGGVSTNVGFETG